MRRIVKIDRGNRDFCVETDNGEIFEAIHVVLAVGTSKFAWIPPQLAELPATLLTHSSEYKGASEFDGKEVTIIGGGDSAIDLAALLHEQGAKVCIIARRHAMAFHTAGGETNRLATATQSFVRSWAGIEISHIYGCTLSVSSAVGKAATENCA